MFVPRTCPYAVYVCVLTTTADISSRNFSVTVAYITHIHTGTHARPNRSSQAHALCKNDYPAFLAKAREFTEKYAQ